MQSNECNDGDKVKVVLGVNDLAVGGVQRLVIDQLNLLDRNRFDLSLIVLTQMPTKGDFYDLIPGGVPVFKLTFKSLRDIKEWLKVIRILAKIRPDIVKSSLFFSNTVFRILQPFFGYRCIAAEHNTDQVKSRFQILLNRLLMNMTYTMVVDSQRVADYLSRTESIDRDRFTVIYNGVDIRAVQESENKFRFQKDGIRSELGIAPYEKVFLTVARLVEQKNHALMIHSFAILAQKRDDVRLLIVGGGGLFDSLKRRAMDLGIESKVVFVGERMDTHRFYAVSDFFLLTSLHEGFCIAAMEGLAFGLPLISTRVAGVSEYLKDGKNGFFSENNPESIAQKMEFALALSDEELGRFAEEGRNTAETYSLDRYGTEYDKLFTSCVKGV